MADFKTHPADEQVLDQNSEDFQRTDPNSGVRRGLKTRHLSMLALAGKYLPDPRVTHTCQRTSSLTFGYYRHHWSWSSCWYWWCSLKWWSCCPYNWLWCHWYHRV